MMKKSIFAVAVASVLTLGAAQAETVLYGSIRYEYQSTKIQDMKKDDGSNVIRKITSDRLSNLEDAGSRIGLKGSEDLGNNNAVIYNLEWGFNGMENGNSGGGFKNRLAVLGLTGNWGTFTAGRQDNPFKVTIVDDSVVDDFNGSTISSAAQRAMTTTLRGQGLSHNTTNVDLDIVNGVPAAVTSTEFVNTVNDTDFSRVGKVIAYTTPDWAGFQANVALMMDADLYPTNDEKNIDLWTINAKYSYDFANAGTLLAKVGYIQGKIADENKSKGWGLFLGYNQDQFGITADYFNGNHKEFRGDNVANGPKEKSQGWDIGGRFSFGPNYYSSIRANYGQNQLKVDGEKDKVKSWAIGFEQKLSSRTRAWVEYGSEETKFAGNNNDKQKDNMVSIGMRHDF